ncbi:MAG: tRNA glutamyl-Q(34) synthetase GluQRS [Polaromonas sp.]|nr:tRNA glutamyl-Q(34) synthetase GluQRS [Polaromonas sp.]
MPFTPDNRLHHGAHCAYRGRFAPSPTGPLHSGSLVAALASWLDARAHGGSWLVRIEDVDTPRCIPGADEFILSQLDQCGLLPDEAPVWQSRRGGHYQAALDQLVADGLAYPCGCTRQDIAQALAAAGQVRGRHEELVYPGTCRSGLHGKPARAWRLRTDLAASRTAAPSLAGDVATHAASPDHRVHWHDRWLGDQSQNVPRDTGDFVLRRADGLWAYQLAVVVDDAAQNITHIVRGADLADNTSRQILLQRALGLPTPSYLHVPLVMGANGEKLSKQNGAQPLVLDPPLDALRAAGAVLGIASVETSTDSWLAAATAQWAALHDMA